MNFYAIILMFAAIVSSGSSDNIKPYTIMIYMNGSDLESEIGAATTDLIEILDSGLNSENANVIIFTGGADYWHNDVIPANECAIWYVADGELFNIANVGLQNMGEPDTLSDFITYAMSHFPAHKYGLVMWDHGGGAIAGFGHDEHFDYYDEGSLTLLEMDYAFKKAGLSGQALEWLGFDACLMATVEMAQIASQYAKYLIASEDLEPGDGWDYKFLGLLNHYPYASGYLLGKEIVDTFMDFYGPNSDEILTLSVIDLNKVQPVMDSMGALMKRCSYKLITGRYSFVTLSERRGNTKTFGEGSPRDSESDMIDIGDMAKQLEDLFPQETAAVHRALDSAVLYNRYNSNIPLYGLSAYYIYGGQFYENLELYAELDVDFAYIWYLQKFFSSLTGQEAAKIPVQKIINGRQAYLYKEAELNDGRIRYTIPAQVNGKDSDIIICMPKERVLGYRHTGLLAKPKGYIPFEEGDLVAFYYPYKHVWLLSGQMQFFDLLDCCEQNHYTLKKKIA